MIILPDSPVMVFATAEVAFLSIYIAAVSTPGDAIIKRFASLVPLTALTYILKYSYCHITENLLWHSTVVAFCFAQLLNASEILCISRVDRAFLSALGKRSSKKDAATTTDTTWVVICAKATGLLWNLRRIGTPWEPKNTPPTRRESRARFLLRRVSLTLLAYLVLDVAGSAPPPEPHLVRRENQTLYDFGQLSTDDVIFRVVGVIGYLFCNALISLVLSNTVNIIMVALRLSRPEDCPTLNGPISKAYTVRNFWG